MSKEYDAYLNNHRFNVSRGYNWLYKNLPAIFDGMDEYPATLWLHHDESKNDPDEYNAYDSYFYGKNRSYGVVMAFKQAWLKHIHRNPHHWQHWVLINDEPEEGEVILEMPYEYIIEMICDWWSFSWAKGDLTEIFSWYGQHSKYIKLAPKTRKTVETILKKIQEKLEENEKGE
jgi:hypothetical protein